MKLSRDHGFSLVEVTMASAIIALAGVGAMGAFSYISRGIMVSQTKTTATNIAREAIASLKAKPYHEIQVSTVTAPDSHFSPALTYDNGANPPYWRQAGLKMYQCQTWIRKAQEVSGGVSYLPPSAPDTGLKEIMVSVVWQDDDNTWRKLQITDLVGDEDPLVVNATFSGTVRNSATSSVLTQAKVWAVEKPARSGGTDASGNFSFSIEPGSYTLRASMPGFSNASVGPFFVDSNQTRALASPIQLTPIAVGSIQGTVYKRDHVVISQVCPAVGSDSVDFIELYNPTTSSWPLNGMILEYVDSGNGTITMPITSFVAPADIPSYGYFLLSNQAAAIGGTTPDAVYFGNIKKDQRGGVKITLGTNVDRIAWGQLSDLPPSSALDAGSTGLILSGMSGPAANQTLERKVIGPFPGPASTESSLDTPGPNGNAFDSDNNSIDWVHHTDNHIVHYVPKNRATPAKTPVSGSPAVGAVVKASDGNSSPAVVSSTGGFVISNVLTGTWSVSASNGLAANTVGTFNIPSAGVQAAVPSIIFLANPVAKGFIKGQVSDPSSVPLSGILMRDSAGNQVRTDANGMYIIERAPGQTTVTANFNDDCPSYIRVSVSSVSVNLGGTTTLNFTLERGGRLGGRLVVNPGPPEIPLPNKTVIIRQGSVDRRTQTNSRGDFMIDRLASGSYIVLPELAANESSSPAYASCSLSSGYTAYSPTFIVRGANGTISGSVKEGGRPISTGVLIYATTATITSPPTLNSALPPGVYPYYGALSAGDGTYALTVPGGVNYNVYAWYTTFNGNTAVTTRKAMDGGALPTVAVTPGQTTAGQDFNW